MASTTPLTPGQLETVAMFTAAIRDEPVSHQASFEIWHDEMDGTLGVSYTSDSLTQIAYFDKNGNMIGNWF